MMKTLVVFIGLLGLSSLAYAGISRSDLAGKFDLSYENAPLSVVLNDISTFSSQNFVFKKKDLQGVFVNIETQNVSLNESLKALLLEHNFEFESLGRGIMIVSPMTAKQTVPMPKVEIKAVAPVSVAEVEVMESEVIEPQSERSVLDKLIQCLEDPASATTLAQFQKRYVNWLKEEGFSTDQAVEVAGMANAAELLLQAQL